MKSIEHLDFEYTNYFIKQITQHTHTHAKWKIEKQTCDIRLCSVLTQTLRNTKFVKIFSIGKLPLRIHVEKALTAKNNYEVE